MSRSGSFRLAAWLRSPVSAAWFPAGPGTLGAVYLLLASAAFARGPIVAPNEPVLGAAAGVIANLVSLRFADEVARDRGDARRSRRPRRRRARHNRRNAGRPAEPIQERPPSSRLRYAGTLLLVVVGLHWFFLAWAMARHPQGYAATFYDAGGLRRAFEIFVTNRLGPGVVVAAGVASTSLFLFGAPHRVAGIRPARTRLASATPRAHRWSSGRCAPSSARPGPASQRRASFQHGSRERRDPRG